MLVRRGDVQTAVHLGDAIDSDRLNQRVNGYRIEVVEPLQTLRLILEETEGIAMDMTWQGSFDVLQEQPHIMRTGSRITLQAQRFAQVGTWSGVVSVDGSEIAVDPSTWVGTRDRSWGIRPVGEPEPAGRPSDPPFEGMWWLYVPMRFDEFAIVLIMQEDPNGFRILNDCTRVWPGGRLEQLGWPKVTIRYASGSRVPTGATIECHDTRWVASAARGRIQRLRCRYTSAVVTAATPIGFTAPGRGRSSPNGAPMTSPTRRTQVGSCSVSSTTSAGPCAMGPEPTVSRGSGSSSTVHWAGTTVGFC